MRCQGRLRACEEALFAARRRDPCQHARPPVRGWSQFEQATDFAASLVREGEIVSVESISEFEAADFEEGPALARLPL